MTTVIFPYWCYKTPLIFRDIPHVKSLYGTLWSASYSHSSIFLPRPLNAVFFQFIRGKIQETLKAWFLLAQNKKNNIFMQVLHLLKQYNSLQTNTEAWLQVYQPFILKATWNTFFLFSYYDGLHYKIYEEHIPNKIQNR